MHEKRVRGWITRNKERYRIFGFGLWAVCLKEAVIAVRDWTFKNTPFNEIYSYMKYTNLPSAQTVISWGCHPVDEYKDEVNEITKEFVISREEWLKNE